jgi:tRNA-intron endonuclease, archaea type
MSESKKAPVEFKTSGTLSDKGVTVTEQSSRDALSSRGYGTQENNILTLTFYESLYLQEKGMLEVKSQNGALDFQGLLQAYAAQNENAWVNYLVYRDLRSRGYVVREGFGSGIDFRIYERGSYGKDTAPYLIMVTQEGKPLPVNDLADALSKCSSQKKELILAVMNRRGEVVHYSVSPLSFSKIDQDTEDSADDDE